jgi:hypothetical protein
MATFKPKSDDTPRTLYFEDVKSDEGYRGHRTGKTIETLKSEVKEAVGRLGGAVVAIAAGDFPGSPERTGYRITFTYGGIPGHIDIAALPCRKATKTNVEQSLKQALFTAREMFEIDRQGKAFIPGMEPIFQYIEDNKGRTLFEAFRQDMLPAPRDK